MVDALLEIGTEEIPASCLENILEELKKTTEKTFNNLKINYFKVESFGTPRRLILWISNLDEKQKDVKIKVKGPAAAIAFDEIMKPQKPAVKFAQSQSINIDELFIENTKKGKYIFAEKTIKGKESMKLLEQCLPKIIQSLNFPKSMRWGTGKLKFIRPIRWILAILGEEVIHFDLDGLSSNNMTFGHKLLTPEQIKVPSIEKYFRILEENFVMIDPIKRGAKIKEEILDNIRKNNRHEIINESQLKEINYMVEYPHAILGYFEEKYLKLPLQVLVTVMEVHQKYFPIYRNKEELDNAFIVVINNTGHNDKEIIKGNENVLKARLEDANFFYQEDLKRPLKNRVEELKNVIFRENMGTLFDKTQRITELSRFIAGLSGLDENGKKIISRAAFLSKADLVTEMVKEFPKLQGTMGKIYAFASDEKKEVSEAVFEHYLPRFAEDKLPKTHGGIILSIADKLDNIVGCFAVGLIPSGSQDPYGLRRQALGIIRTVIESRMEISLIESIRISLSIFKEDIFIDLKDREETVVDQIIIFLQQRLKNVLLEKGIFYDVIDAVLSAEKECDIHDIQSRIHAIQDLYHSEMFGNIINSAIRLMNISKGNHEIEINESLLKEEDEIHLYHQYIKHINQFKDTIQNGNYHESYEILGELCPYIHDFFDQVLVMDKDELVRKNRVGLIKKLSNLFNHVAILSKISQKKDDKKS